MVLTCTAVKLPMPSSNLQKVAYYFFIPFLSLAELQHPEAGWQSTLQAVKPSHFPRKHPGAH